MSCATIWNSMNILYAVMWQCGDWLLVLHTMDFILCVHIWIMKQYVLHFIPLFYESRGFCNNNKKMVTKIYVLNSSLLCHCLVFIAKVFFCGAFEWNTGEYGKQCVHIFCVAKREIQMLQRLLCHLVIREVLTFRNITDTYPRTR